MVQIHAPAPPDRPTSLPVDPLSARAELPLRAELERLLELERPSAGETWLLAFSGGPDSTALAAALAPLAAGRTLHLLAVHLDHGADPGSAERAAAARELARRSGVEFHLERRDLPRERRRGESPEAAARRVRYTTLENVRIHRGATLVLTAHQRDDQIETVLLRLLHGSGLEGLAGIPECRDRLRRPLLRVSRATIEHFLREAGLEPVEDPTNLDLLVPRNRVRHLLLPHLRAAEPEVEAAVLALAGRAAVLRRTLDSALRRGLGPASSEGGAAVGALLGLPAPLRIWALRWLLRRDGTVRLPSNPSMEAFLVSLHTAGRAELRLGAGGRRLLARDGRVSVAGPKSPVAPFSYTFPLPGEVELAHPAARLRVRRSRTERWMFRGDARRAGLALPASPGAATVRSRRPGDRIWPLGAPGERKLKDLLIDRRVPAAERERLPLLEIGGRIAWVPGVAVDERCRLTDQPDCWIAELLPAGAAGESDGADGG